MICPFWQDANIAQLFETCQWKFSIQYLKGDYPPKLFYRPNLIFWIVMGCGKAHFGRKGQKPSKIENFGLKVCSLGPRGDPHMRPRGNLR